MSKRLFPSRTARNGLIRRNSANDGSGQGKGSKHRFFHCQFCGAVNDLNRIKTFGGTDDGNGARGPITKTSETGTLLSGTTFTEKYGNAALRKGAGCWLCLSPNSAR